MAFTPTAIAYYDRGGGGSKEDAAEIRALGTGTLDGAAAVEALGTTAGGAGAMVGTGAFQIPTGFRIVEVLDATNNTLAVGGVSHTPVFLPATCVLTWRVNSTGVLWAAGATPATGAGGARFVIRAVKVA